MQQEQKISRRAAIVCAATLPVVVTASVKVSPEMASARLREPLGRYFAFFWYWEKNSSSLVTEDAFLYSFEDCRAWCTAQLWRPGNPLYDAGDRSKTQVPADDFYFRRPIDEYKRALDDAETVEVVVAEDEECERMGVAILRQEYLWLIVPKSLSSGHPELNWKAIAFEMRDQNPDLPVGARIDVVGITGGGGGSSALPLGAGIVGLYRAENRTVSCRSRQRAA